MAKKFSFQYNGRKIEVDQELLTGAQIKAAIKAVDSTLDLSHDLILEGHGNDPDRPIADGETVSLDHAHGGIKKFHTRPPTNFG